MRITIYLILIILINSSYAIIPLPSSPSWTSIDNDYSTGAGFADINNDGYIDFCTANGNDMAINKQGIYINNNGILPIQASWRSADSGYFGHLYLGDINNDGYTDMAVSFLGLGLGNQGKTRIYKNTGTGLQPTPYWFSSDQYNSFDVCFGDVDLDGDLDLAVAAGDAYNNINDPARIYKNNNGIFESSAYWSSIDSTPSDAIRFADLNQDGYLDLIVGGYHRLSIYYNQNGTFSQTPSWSITERGWILRIATADYNNDNWIDIAVAVNGQLSGDSSRIKVFQNNQGQINNLANYTMLRNRHYCSCVAWADINNDGYQDLAAGGWWEPLVVFENHLGILDTLPSWSWSNSSLVSEAIVFGDVRNHYLVIKTDTFISNGTKKLFFVRKNPVQKLISVSIQNNTITPDNYCFDLMTGWVVLRNAPIIGDTVKITYFYSSYLDLAVTNWTASVGNYLFYNTTPQSITENALDLAKNQDFIIYPNPFTSEIRFYSNVNKISSIKIYDVSGKLIKIISDNCLIWNCKDDNNKEVANGVYFVKIFSNNKTFNQKVIKNK